MEGKMDKMHQAGGGNFVTTAGKCIDLLTSTDDFGGGPSFPPFLK